MPLPITHLVHLNVDTLYSMLKNHVELTPQQWVYFHQGYTFICQKPPCTETIQSLLSVPLGHPFDILYLNDTLLFLKMLLITKIR